MGVLQSEDTCIQGDIGVVGGGQKSISKLDTWDERHTHTHSPSLSLSPTLAHTLSCLHVDSILGEGSNQTWISSRQQLQPILRETSLSYPSPNQNNCFDLWWSTKRFLASLPPPVCSSFCLDPQFAMSCMRLVMVGRKDGVEDIFDTVQKCVTYADTPNPVYMYSRAPLCRKNSSR